jgi:hypothetical protein
MRPNFSSRRPHIAVSSNSFFRKGDIPKPYLWQTISSKILHSAKQIQISIKTTEIRWYPFILVVKPWKVKIFVLFQQLRCMLHIEFTYYMCVPKSHGRLTSTIICCNHKAQWSATITQIPWKLTSWPYILDAIQSRICQDENFQQNIPCAK